MSEQQIEMMNVDQPMASLRDDLPYFVKRGIKRGQDTINRLHNVTAGNGYIAGSYAAWASAPVAYWEPSDIDIFCVSQTGLTRILEALTFNGFYVLEANEKVISMRPHPTSVIQAPIQLIYPHPNWHSFPLDIMKSFDLDICRAVIMDTQWALADQNAGGNIGLILAINNPIRMVKRLLKYGARGVTFSDRDLIKLFSAWESMTEDQKNTAIIAMLPEPEHQADYEYHIDWDEHFFTE